MLARRAFAGGLLAFTWPLTSRAMWASLSDDELLQRSSLIALGEWVGQSAVALPEAGGRLDLGAIALSEVLKGAAGQTLALVRAVPLEVPRSSSDLRFRRGDRGLWLLRSEAATGLYQADHPQCFVPEARGTARIQLLRRKLVSG